MQPLPLEPPAAARRPPPALPGKYQPLRCIGSGAMGTVVLAKDRHLGRLVAIKLLHTDCRTYLARLRREARLLAKLEHPAIVRVHELDVFAGKLHLVMEYAAGGNLAGARLEPLPLVRTVRGVVDALAHAHAHGVVHRDVKPENILLLGPGAGAPVRVPAILSDFGLACRSGEGSEELRRPIAGTPATMSPEQVNQAPVGPKSDIFAFGATLYRLLTGRWPFCGRTVLDVFDAINHQEPKPMRASGRAVPRRLEHVVRRALAKDQDRRFASMEELGEALDRCLRGRSVFAFSRNRRSRRHNPKDPS